jgi:hypothetical protein
MYAPTQQGRQRKCKHRFILFIFSAACPISHPVFKHSNSSPLHPAAFCFFFHFFPHSFSFLVKEWMVQASRMEIERRHDTNFKKSLSGLWRVRSVEVAVAAIGGLFHQIYVG